MSINPVTGIGPTDKAQLAVENPRSAAVQPSTAKFPIPDPGTSPKQEIQSPQSAAAPSEMPQDEVQVQRDSATNGEIVIKYLDRSGNVILQIPTSQMLAVSHAIDQELESEEKARANEVGTQTGHDGGIHGH